MNHLNHRTSEYADKDKTIHPFPFLRILHDLWFTSCFDFQPCIEDRPSNHPFTNIREPAVFRRQIFALSPLFSGYRDWEDQQAALAEARRVLSQGRELANTGKGSLADGIAAWIIGRYIIVTRRLMECRDDKKGWKLLRELCHDVVALRRGDHSAEWLKE